MSSSVYRPSATLDHEIEPIKGSRFLCRLIPAESAERVAEEQAVLRRAHPKSCHVCTAYVGVTEHDRRYSDDGEPAKTAGLPMTQVLLGQHLRHCGALVTRYFGGVKLGTGGLVRAYSAAVREASRLVERTRLVPMCSVKWTVPYELEGYARMLLSDLEACELEAQYAEHVCLACRISNENRAKLSAVVRELPQRTVLSD